jgi:hypothetical protein
MINMRHGPKIVARPAETPEEFSEDVKSKLYAVKVSLGDVVLAEGVVELPDGAQAPKPKESAS